MSAVGSWIEMVVGAPLPATSPLISIEGIAERRAFYESLPAPPDPAGAVVLDEHLVLREGRAPLTAELYEPSGRDGSPLPAFLFLHGGAFCIWNARMVRRAAMRIAAAGFVVVNLDYRLAPEAPFPGALIDTIHAARWIHEHADALGVDPSTGLSMGGDSAGANLAASATSYFLSEDTRFDGAENPLGRQVRIRQLLLSCGIYDLGRRMIEPPSGPGTTEIMVNLAYLGPQFLPKHSDHYVSPARSVALADFPRTYVACGSEDNTLPQSLRLTETLAQSGRDVTLSVFPHGDHEMLLLREDQLPGVDAEWDRILTWLSQPARG